MKNLLKWAQKNQRQLSVAAFCLLVLGGLFSYKLASLTSGLSASEIASATNAVGWHGIYHDPVNLPLKLVRSVVFGLAPDHGQLLTRLPNILFGMLSVIIFAFLIRGWHSTRTALFTTVLFATSAWVLHVSRLASFDVQYLLAIIVLLRIDQILPRDHKKPFMVLSTLIAWLVLLYIPGMVWLVGLSLYLQRKAVAAGWSYLTKTGQRAATIVIALLGIVPLLLHLVREGGIATWLGLPAHFPSVIVLIKQILLVPVHLLIHGPHNPELWLGRVSLLDIFTLLITLLGFYFYAQHRAAHRTRMLALYVALGWILVGLGGAVSLTVLVPLLYVAAGTGITYLLHEWLKVFPMNPLARGVGIGLVAIAVSLSCLYNLRAYFIAWPHNSETRAVFIYHR